MSTTTCRGTLPAVPSRHQRRQPSGRRSSPPATRSSRACPTTMYRRRRYRAATNHNRFARLTRPSVRGVGTLQELLTRSPSAPPKSVSSLIRHPVLPEEEENGLWGGRRANRLFLVAAPYLRLGRESFRRRRSEGWLEGSVRGRAREGRWRHANQAGAVPRGRVRTSVRATARPSRQNEPSSVEADHHHV